VAVGLAVMSGVAVMLLMEVRHMGGHAMVKLYFSL
jgi:hypothetical protein